MVRKEANQKKIGDAVSEYMNSHIRYSTLLFKCRMTDGFWLLRTVSEKILDKSIQACALINESSENDSSDDSSQWQTWILVNERFVKSVTFRLEFSIQRKVCFQVDGFKREKMKLGNFFILTGISEGSLFSSQCKDHSFNGELCSKSCEYKACFQRL